MLRLKLKMCWKAPQPCLGVVCWVHFSHPLPWWWLALEGRGGERGGGERGESQEKLGGRWTGATSSNLLKNRFIGLIQVSLHPLDGLCSMASDGSHATPHLPDVLLLELPLKLSSVALLPLCDLFPQFSLHLHLLLVSTPEGCHLPVQWCLDVFSHPGFVVGETVHSLGWAHAVCAEMYIVCYAACESIYVVPMCITENIPVCYLKTALKSLLCFLRPPLYSSGDHWLLLDCRFIERPKVDQVVIWSELWNSASLTLAYSRSSVWFSQVLQSTNWLKVGRVVIKVKWLKSPDIDMNTLGCSVCSLVELRTSAARNALAAGGI